MEEGRNRMTNAAKTGDRKLLKSINKKEKSKSGLAEKMNLSRNVRSFRNNCILAVDKSG